MGNKRTASDFQPCTPTRPVSKRLRGRTGYPLITTPPRSAAAAVTTPHRMSISALPPQPPQPQQPQRPQRPQQAQQAQQLQQLNMEHHTSTPPSAQQVPPSTPPASLSPPPSLPQVSNPSLPSSLPVTPARPPRMPRFDRDRANDTASDRKLVNRLNRLSPSEIIALVKDVEHRLRQLTAFEAEEINRAKRLGFSQSATTRHSPPVPVHPPPLQAAW